MNAFNEVHFPLLHDEVHSGEDQRGVLVHQR